MTRIRVVLTNGVAGIGKTFSVQKFTLDWAEGLENQDVSLVVLLSFRELNLIKEEKYSLLRLLHVFHPTLQKVTAEELAVWRPLFIFDGLDESRLSLDFKKMERVSDANQESSVNILLMNLIKGNLLPSALVWITSRPAAANQIPPECFDRVTEVRGFTDDQKEEYFKRRFPDEDLYRRIISNVKTSKSIYIMCQIPVFCWITATVLEHMLTPDQGGELPKTLTDMYSHFLLVQTKRKKQKYDEGHERSQQELMETDREVLLKLGRLAFKHLEKGNIMFYQEDLEQCGLDVSEVLVESGVCAEIFKRESVIFQKTVYCFVHRSIQEFLAAVYMINCYTNRNTSQLKAFLGHDCSGSPFDVFLKRTMEKSLDDMDLFVCFLHGLSLESNQKLLGSLLGPTDSNPSIIKRVINNLKEMNTFRISPDRRINIFHCLIEMNDQSVYQEVQAFLKKEDRSEKELSMIDYSALARMLLMSEEVLEELDLRMYSISIEGQHRLIPVVRNCRKAVLSWCELSDDLCEVVASALMSNPSHLRELNLSYNYNLLESEVMKLSAGLRSPDCRLKTLRLLRCSLSAWSCSNLARALKVNPFHLRELDLSENPLGDSGVAFLKYYLRMPDCRLETLRLSGCGLTNNSCRHLAEALTSNPSHLRLLDLSDNRLKDKGVEMFCDSLKNVRCRLETLRLQRCEVSGFGCQHLASALKSKLNYLREVELGGNLLDYSERKPLLDLLASPEYSLDSLSFTGADGSPLLLTGVQKQRDLKGSSESAGSRQDQKFSVEEPGPSYTKKTGREQHTPEEYPSTSTDSMPGGRRAMLTEQHLMKIVFTPEVQTASGKNSYRFRCPGPGLFQCALTGLGFYMVQGAELTYKPVQWDHSLIQTAGKVAAGMLFDITCSEDSAVCQLHLPHCETMDAALCDNILSAVLMTDDGMSILDTLRINGTHVVVKVPHLSPFGLLWDYINRFWNNSQPIGGQVLLFLRTPSIGIPVLDVFLLQKNIPLPEVAVQQEEAVNIRISSDCHFICGQSYSLHCKPKGINIQPSHVPFETKTGPNFYPTFEVFLAKRPEKMTLIVLDQENREVWKRDVHLKGSEGETVQSEATVLAMVPAEEAATAEEKLDSIRLKFIKGASEPTLNQLLDQLLHHKVLIQSEVEAIIPSRREHKARELIKTVKNKGKRASEVLIAAICRVDECFAKELNLNNR